MEMLSMANIDGGLSIPNLPSDNVTIHCLIHMFLKKITNVIYLILSIVHHESIDFFSCYICHDCRSYRSYE